MSEGILAAVVIVAIVIGAACFAIRHLNKTAGRIAVVIGSLAVLVGALVPVVRILVEAPPAQQPAQVVAPAHPNPPGPATAGSSAGAGGGAL
ncbi:hypothetical protein [Streptomyces sp. NPDC048603]|uniref:hypothetical protein n=1 Tax=Streptomyces sp. NPDC048603 TaxID=3365577 RepID=UPI00371BB2B8